MADKSLASQLNELVRLERPVPDDSLDGAGSGTWELVEEIWARVRDVLPSRGERLEGGISAATRPARIRIRFREDVTGDMRFVLGSRVMQIVAGPAEATDLDPRQALDFMVEDYSPAGNPA
jgi:head-tail adaptor